MSQEGGQPPVGPGQARPFGEESHEPLASPRPSGPPPESPFLGWDGPTLPPPPALEFRAAATDPYPMRFAVAYPARLSRISTFFRLFFILPVWFVGLILQYLVGSGIFVGWGAVFFRKRYPEWLFLGLSGAFAWYARAWAYATLVTDKFPSLDPVGSPVSLEFDRPAAGSLSRWRVLVWKLVLLFPHLFLLTLLSFTAAAVTTLAWFAILLTGRYPRGLFGFTTGIMRWSFRLTGYFASFNDRFPPFALSARAGPASRGAVAVSAVFGLLGVGAFAAIIAAAAAIDSGSDAEVDYARLQRGQADVTRFFIGPRDQPEFVVSLNQVTDPATDLERALAIDPASRLVIFEFTYFDITGRGDDLVQAADFRLNYEVSGAVGRVRTMSIIAAFVRWPGGLAPARLGPEEEATLHAAFLIPRDARPSRLHVNPPWGALDTIRYDFN